ncbi:hypothetical protein H0H87_008655 [Tephrocybe sp. NHM501043]|nr:hypothetical protein H0H87_008655 [Tephrocybe sp. NHM501043]
MADTVIVDDTDPRVKFSNQWYTSGDINEYNSTAHGTRTAGQTVTLTFSGKPILFVNSISKLIEYTVFVVGSYVAVYGRIPSTSVNKDPPVSTYSIDGSTPYTFTPSTYSTPHYKQRYFASPKLSDGEHTLVITSTLELAFFWIDYFEITPSVAKIAPAAAPAVSTIITTAIITPDFHITTKNSGDSTLVNVSPTTSPTTPTTKASATSKDDDDGELQQFNEGESSLSVTPFTASTPAMEQAYDQGSLLHSDSTGPYSGMGYGYVVHGGTKARSMHQSQPSGSGSNSTMGLLLNAERDTSESSTSSGYAGLVPATKATDFGGAPVVRVESQPPVSPSGMHGPQQSLSIMPLYDDVPPAYIQCPPGGPL